jgi:hypothetical protein
LLGFFHPPKFLAGTLRAFFRNLLDAPVSSFGVAAGAKFFPSVLLDHGLTPFTKEILVQGYGLHRAINMPGVQCTGLSLTEDGNTSFLTRGEDVARERALNTEDWYR